MEEAVALAELPYVIEPNITNLIHIIYKISCKENIFVLTSHVFDVL